jgi:NodT family efflux transporter outer membrane factor (OMF) lipoprotein
MRAVRLFLALSVVAIVTASCAHRPEPLKASDVPKDWGAALPAEAQVWPAPDWWRGFQSAELDSLIAAARGANLDLAAAAARVLQAKAEARIAASALFPEVDLGASAAQRGPLVPRDSDAPSESRSVDLTAGASYELDFWGKNRANLRSAKASLRASRYDQETVALTVTAGVATTYFQVLSLRERLAIARLNLADAERVLSLVQARLRAGVVSPLDLAQEEATVARQRATIPALEQQERVARAALAILLGLPPQGFDLQAVSLEGVAAPLVAPGLTSALLARRPDIARAEAALAAADADVAAARAAFFPSIDLTGSAGFTSTTLAALVNGASGFYGVAASLAQPIFNAGRLVAETEAAQARRKELIADYRASIIGAFSDVMTSLGAIESLAAQETASQAARDAARRASSLSEVRYKAGVDTLLTLLNAQQTLYQSEDDLAQTRFARLQALVGLYRALGGGWQNPEAMQTAAVNSHNG